MISTEIAARLDVLGIHQVYTRPLEALIKDPARNLNFEQMVALDDRALDAVRWWLRTFTLWDGRSILANALPDLTIELDASEQALGASIPRLG